MVPNITLDNAVQRHVDALGENRAAGWEEGDDKWVEWNYRKEYACSKRVRRFFDLTDALLCSPPQTVED